MRIVYSKHALERMEFRSISKDAISDAIETYDTKEKVDDSCIVNKFLNGKMLRVIYRECANHYILITAYITYRKRYTWGNKQ